VTSHLTKDIESPPANGKKLPIEDQLKGKTLQVYMYMAKKKDPVGVREVQRDLGFSSPSVANYHIDKLAEMALISQDEHGRYYVVQKVQIGVLQAFVNIGGLTVPRLSFFAAFFTTMLLAYTTLNIESLNIYAIGFALAGAGAFWFETIRVWIKKPIV
jgi:predicted DNA-binding transcriptional regulator